VIFYKTTNVWIIATILIIDISLPKMSGIDLLEIIRQRDHTTKAMMLTAHSTADFLLRVTDLKLSRYLIKPITRDELRDALSTTIAELEQFSTVSKEILVLRDGYSWDLKDKRLLSGNVTIGLSVHETKILDLLCNNLNTDISYEKIIIYVWDDFERDKTNSLKMAINRLRKKLPSDTIQNIYGFAYRVES